MTLPYAKESVTDGALGIASDDPTKVVVVMGHSTLGTAHQIYRLTQLPVIRATLGRGKGPEQVANVLAAGKGKITVLFMPLDCDPGSLGSVTKTAVAGGTGDGVVADNSSEPDDDYDLVIKITKSGAVGTALFVHSLNGGRTFTTRAVATAATVDIGDTGISVAFTGTGFDAGDKFAAHAEGPTYDHTELATGLDALLEDSRRWKIVHAVGFPAGADAAARAAESWECISTLDAKLVVAFGTSRYAMGVIDAAGAHAGVDVADSVIKAAFEESLILSAAGAGFCPLTSPLDGGASKRPSSWPIVARISAAPIHEHAGRVKSGPLERVGRLRSNTDDPISWSYHDESIATEALDESGFLTLRTIKGKTGVYATRGSMMTPPTSDFRVHQYRLVMNEACTVGHDAMLEYLNDDLRVDKVTGKIDDRDAQAIEADVLSKLTVALVNEGHASAVSFVLDRDTNLLSTKTLKYRVRVKPKGYPEFIDGEFGFENPFFAVAA